LGRAAMIEDRPAELLLRSETLRLHDGRWYPGVAGELQAPSAGTAGDDQGDLHAQTSGLDLQGLLRRSPPPTRSREDG
jgi:hypothetical protein